MGFEKGNRRGKLWDDVMCIDHLIKTTPLNYTGKSEKDFEMIITSMFDANVEKFNGQIISQTNKAHKVDSVYCFGKNHRPDITIDHNGIAIEVKYLSTSLDGIKTAIGQSLVYRLQYKFAVNIFVLSKTHKDVYLKACNGEEHGLADLFKYLAEETGTFSYVIPAFALKDGVPKFFEANSL